VLRGSSEQAHETRVDGSVSMAESVPGQEEERGKQSRARGLIIGIIECILALCFIRSYIKDGNPIVLVIGISFGIVVLRAFILPFVRFRGMKVVYWLCDLYYTVFPLSLMLFATVIAPWFAMAVTLLAIDFLISSTLQGVTKIGVYIDMDVFRTPIRYVSTLVTATLFAYSGEKIILEFHDILIGDAESSPITRRVWNRYIKKINCRKRVYELYVLFYILSVIEKLSGTQLINSAFWMVYKDMALEVLLSFVAIDTYVMNCLRSQ